MKKNKVSLINLENKEFDLTVILPCLNESETLAQCIRKCNQAFMALNVKGQVLVVDNGSTDGSDEIAASEGARVIYEEKKGYGSAIKKGISFCNSEFIVMADSDDSYSLEDLSDFYKELESGFDLVMGNRFKGGIEKNAMPFLHKYLGNPVLSWIGRKLFKVPIGDFHSGIRAFKKSSIVGLGLSSNGMEFASEMVVKASLADLKITEVPTKLRKDGRSRKPHLNTWKDGWRHLKFLLLMSPSWVFFVPSVLAITIGLAGVSILSFGPVTINNVEFSIQTLYVFYLILLIGFQIFAMGIISYKYTLQKSNEIVKPKLSSFSQVLVSKFVHMQMEKYLIVGFLATLVGFLVIFSSFSTWVAADFGPLNIYTNASITGLGGSLVLLGFIGITSALALGAMDFD